MKRFFLAVCILINVEMAFASDVITSRGLANGPRNTNAEALYYEAKAKAIRQLPQLNYVQISDWRTTIVDVGPQRYVSAEAEFEAANEN